MTQLHCQPTCLCLLVRGISASLYYALIFTGYIHYSKLLHFVLQHKLPFSWGIRHSVSLGNWFSLRWRLKQRTRGISQKRNEKAEEHGRKHFQKAPVFRHDSGYVMREKGYVLQEWASLRKKNKKKLQS